MIVVDTNAVVHLVVGGAKTEAARRAFRKDPEWAAPVLWRSEFRNVLTVLVRRRMLALVDALETSRQAEDVMAGREFGVETQTVLELAARSGCSAYDCEFVALASELGVPLLTSDGEVLAAFPKLAITIERFAAK